MIHQADLYLEAIQGNLIQILSFLIGHTINPHALFFQDRKQNWKNIVHALILFMRADSDLPRFSLRQQNFNVMAPPGLNPVPLRTKPKLYHGALL